MPFSLPAALPPAWCLLHHRHVCQTGRAAAPPSTQVKTCPFPSPLAFALAPFVPILWVPSP